MHNGIAIPLYKAEPAFVDTVDWHSINQYRWFLQRHYGSANDQNERPVTAGYAVRNRLRNRADTAPLLMHRMVVWNAIHEMAPGKCRNAALEMFSQFDVHHVEPSQKLDNRRSALQVTTRRFNRAHALMIDRHPRGGAPQRKKLHRDVTYYGVSFKDEPHRRKKWLCRYKGECCGYFYTAEDAARAYDEIAFNMEGQAAILNFPLALWCPTPVLVLDGGLKFYKVGGTVG